MFMQVNPKSVKSHFEKTMDKYDANAVVQKFLAEILTAETASVRDSYGKILELGCGTGLLTREIKEKIRFDSYTANDLSEKSKKYLDKILPDYDFICGNAARIAPNSTFDLIISNAMFQWFSNLDEVVNRYRNLLNKDGILAFTTFSPDNFPELKKVTGLSLKYKTDEELKEVLEKNYKILKMETFSKTLEFKTPLELLYHLKNTGVNSLSKTKWGIKEVKNFCDRYKAEYPELELTYKPVIITANGLI